MLLAAALAGAAAELRPPAAARKVATHPLPSFRFLAKLFTGEIGRSAVKVNLISKS